MGDYPTGEPLLSTEQMRRAAQGPPPEPVPPPNWGTKSQARGDAWLAGDDKPKRPVNKARGALFACLITDEMIADAQMREKAK